MVDRRTGGVEHGHPRGHPLGGAGAVRRAAATNGVAARAGRAACGSPGAVYTTSHKEDILASLTDEFAGPHGRAAGPGGGPSRPAPDTRGSCCAATPSCSMAGTGGWSGSWTPTGRAARDARRDGGTPAAGRAGRACSPRAVRARSATSTRRRAARPLSMAASTRRQPTGSAPPNAEMAALTVAWSSPPTDNPASRPMPRVWWLLAG